MPWEPWQSLQGHRVHMGTVQGHCLLAPSAICRVAPCSQQATFPGEVQTIAMANHEFHSHSAHVPDCIPKSLCTEVCCWDLALPGHWCRAGSAQWPRADWGEPLPCWFLPFPSPEGCQQDSRRLCPEGLRGVWQAVGDPPPMALTLTTLVSLGC